jgi:hypothetical protein
MAHEPDDADLKRLFAAMREADARQRGPGFGATWTRAAAAASRRSRRPARWAIAGGAFAVGALLMVVLLRRPAQPPVVDVVGWESPTAVLLRGPGDALLRDVPTLGSSSIQFITVPNVPGDIP